MYLLSGGGKGSSPSEKGSLIPEEAANRQGEGDWFKVSKPVLYESGDFTFCTHSQIIRQCQIKHDNLGRRSKFDSFLRIHN